MIFKRIRLTIATKLISASLILLLLATLPLAWQNSQYFEGVSVQREEEANLQTAIAKASEINQTLKGLIEKSRALGSVYLQISRSDQNSLKDSIRAQLEADRDLFAMDIYRMDEGDMRLASSLVKKGLLEDLKKDPDFIERLREKKPFPVASVSQGNIEIQVATVDAEIPLMIIGFPLERNDLGRVSAVMLTYLQLSRIQRSFNQVGSRRVFLLDQKGGVLAHPTESLMLEGRSLNQHPVYRSSQEQPDQQGSLIYEGNDAGTWTAFRGAFARTTFGPVVISEIADQAIKLPALEARRQSVRTAGLVISISLLFVFILSMTFSAPIERLAEFIREVGRGNYEISAQSKIRSNDELGLLAKTFDEMVLGLKERAKAYAVMRQALGASVIETLMNMKEEELGGQKKLVTVLFSDLRDFTKFSEGHSPEEVVTMLNEYFDVMVKVITDNGGWLDKFIGDAIMAVWGVPYPREGDDERALNAAIEMRIALAQLNERREARGLHALKIGIGLHTGEAIVGKIGATERANLTVIGDTVNQASRIEATTKAFGVDILVSNDLAVRVEKRFSVQHIGNAEVKGKTEPLRLFKLNGFRDETGKEIRVQTAYSEYQAEAVDKVKVA